MDAALAELHGKRQLLAAASDDVASLRAQLHQAEHVLRVATLNYTVALNVYQQQSDSLRVLLSSTSYDGARGSSKLAAEPSERRIAGVRVPPRKPVIEYESWRCGWRDDTDRRTRIMDPPIDLQIIQAHNFVVKVAGHHTPTGRISNEVCIPCIICVDIHSNQYVRAYVYIYILIYIYVIVHLQVSVTPLVHI